MVSTQEVQAQLKRIGVEIRFWGRAEVKELQHILLSGEQIQHAVNGRYDGGFAMLVATDMRVLLIDKKPFYLTLEDIRYDMVAEVDFSHRLLDASIRICSVNKEFRFTSMRHRALRMMTMYIQERAMSWRQQGMFHQAITNTTAAAATTQGMTPQPQLAGEQTAVGKVAMMGMSAAHPYRRAPLIMRKRISRFYPSQHQNR